MSNLLYHYTSEAGLLGIIASDRIWATDIHLLNDWTEFRHLFTEASLQPLVEAFLAGLPSDVDCHALEEFTKRVLRNSKGLLNAIESRQPPNEPKEVFVCSFSSDGGDRLSQWRGYSPSSQGFSLGFDSAALKKQTESCTTSDILVELVDCIYDESKKSEWLRESGHIAASAFPKSRSSRKPVPPEFSKEHPDTYHLHHSFTKATIEFYRFAAQSKHSGFREEGEWRVLYRAYRKKLLPNTVKFRNGPFGLTPYVEIPLGMHVLSTCPLRRIVIGPGSQSESVREDTKHAVEMFLGKHGIAIKPPNIDGVEVGHSFIPYRSA